MLPLSYENAFEVAYECNYFSGLIQLPTHKVWLMYTTSHHGIMLTLLGHSMGTDPGEK